MILYEVNLKVQTDCFNAFRAWLTSHIETMLTFPGFLSAKTLLETSDVIDGFQKITVQYTLDTQASLQHYLAHHATQMRHDGIQRFPNQFSATRRVFNIENTSQRELSW